LKQHFRHSLLSEVVGALDAATRGAPGEAHLVVRRICDLANDIAPCSKVCLWLVDGNLERLVLKAGDDFDGTSLELDESHLPGLCALKREVINIKQVEDLPEKGPFTIGRTRVKSTLVLPVEGADGAMIAVLQMVNKLACDSEDKVGSLPQMKKASEARKTTTMRRSVMNIQLSEAEMPTSKRATVYAGTAGANNIMSPRSLGIARHSQPPVVSDQLLPEDDKGNVVSFTRSDEETAAVLCASVAIALRTSGLVSELQQSGRTVQALRAVLDGLHHAKTVEELVAETRAQVKQVLECERVTFYFVDPQKQELWSTPTEETPFGIRLEVGQGHAGRVAVNGGTYRQNNVQLDLRHDKRADAANNFTTRAIVTVAVSLHPTGQSADKNGGRRSVPIKTAFQKSQSAHLSKKPELREDVARQRDRSHVCACTRAHACARAHACTRVCVEID
jgi:GAF domain-containing protein